MDEHVDADLGPVPPDELVDVDELLVEGHQLQPQRLPVGSGPHALAVPLGEAEAVQQAVGLGGVVLDEALAHALDEVLVLRLAARMLQGALARVQRLVDLVPVDGMGERGPEVHLLEQLRESPGRDGSGWG